VSQQVLSVPYCFLSQQQTRGAPPNQQEDAAEKNKKEVRSTNNKKQLKKQITN
jgi:hypothetical protein